MRAQQGVGHAVAIPKPPESRRIPAIPVGAPGPQLGTPSPGRTKWCGFTRSWGRAGSCLATPRCDRHTPKVNRLACVVLVGALVGTAQAEVEVAPPQPPVDPDRGNFWRDMLAPHKDEVDMIIVKA